MNRALSFAFVLTPLALGSFLPERSEGQGCQKPVTADECTRMLDRYVAQKLLMDPVIGARPEREKHEYVGSVVRENHERATYRTRHGECLRDVSRRQFQCAIDALSPDGWEACLD